MENTELNKALNSIGELIVEKIRRNAKVQGFNATGKLYDSWNYKIIEDELKIHAEKYAGALSGGSKPSKSSSDWQGKKTRLEEWIKAKGIRPYRKLKNGYKFAKMSTDRRSAYKSMVYSISKSISEKGIVKRYNYKGGKFVELTVQQTKKQIEEMLSKAYLKDIKNNLNKLGE